MRAECLESFFRKESAGCHLLRTIRCVQVRKYGTTKQEAKYITDKDLLQDLPHCVWLNNYPFTLLEADKFTVRYRNKGDVASLLRCARPQACVGLVECCRLLWSASNRQQPRVPGGIRRHNVRSACVRASMSESLRCRGRLCESARLRCRRAGA